MSKYLFDTNIVSYFAKGKYPNLTNSILEVNNSQRFINWVVQQELLCGVFGSGRIDLESKYKAFFGLCNIIHSDGKIVEICSKLEARLDWQGLTVGFEDAWIAATCIAKDLILVTNNLKHFGNIPDLKIKNWAE